MFRIALPVTRSHMLAYRCYLLRANGRIAKAIVIEAPNEAAVSALARGQFKITEECPTVEIWRRDRLVARLAYQCPE